MPEPLVSVVIPTWNRAVEVRASIASVLEQTYRPIELVVVDDGSTDETPEVLASYGDKIRTVRQRNMGVSAARNSGIREAKGEFLAFLDSDDTWDGRKIEKQMELLAAAGDEASCCLSNALLVSSDGATKRCFEYAHFDAPIPQGVLLNPVEIFLTRAIFFNQNVLVRRDLLLGLGGFDPDLAVQEDHDLALRLGLCGPFAYTTEPLAKIHRDTRHSLTTMAYGNQLVLFENLAAVYAKLLGVGDKWNVPRPRREGGTLTPREAKFARRALARAGAEVEQIRSGRRPGLLTVAWERIWGAIWTRSPLYPSPVVRRLDAARGREAAR